MPRILTILCLASCFLLTLSSGQTFLPKEGDLPISDVYAVDITRSGRNDFWKTNSDGWAYIFSAYPVRMNAVTQVTFYLVVGNQFSFGCGNINKSNGQFNKSLNYNTLVGRKWNGISLDYASTAIAGDKITMTIDTRPFQYTMSFAKNGLDMGIAFSGLNLLGEDQIYIIIWMYKVMDRIKIVDYKVVE